jgi:hypothetical protein
MMTMPPRGSEIRPLGFKLRSAFERVGSPPLARPRPGACRLARVELGPFGVAACIVDKYIRSNSAGDHSRLRPAYPLMFFTSRLKLDSAKARVFCIALAKQNLHGSGRNFQMHVVDFPPHGGSLVERGCK